MADDQFIVPGVLRRQLVDESWKARAACRTENPGPDDIARFFPPKGESQYQVDRVRAECAACPVTDECLSYAMDHQATVGIWGGTSEKERKRLRRQGWRKLPPLRLHGTDARYKAGCTCPSCMAAHSLTVQVSVERRAAS